MHLPNLYSLSVRFESNHLLILGKTSKTVKVKEFVVPGIPVGAGVSNSAEERQQSTLEFKRRRRTPPPPPALEDSSVSMMILDKKSSNSGGGNPKVKKILRSDSPTLGASEVSAAVREVKKSKYSGSLSS